MAMLRKTITIPEAMEDWIKAQIESGRYGNDSEYVRDLIRRDQDRQAGVKALQAAIEEGLVSGISERSLDDILADARARAAKSADEG
jgi:antitoxin ParD1/3/4